MSDKKQKPRRKKGPLRTQKITFRATEKIAAAKPPEESWGDYIERLQAIHAHRDPYAVTRTRYAAWAAVSLDLLARDIPERFPSDSKPSFAERLNRLEAMAKIIHEIAEVRAIMEEYIYGHK